MMAMTMPTIETVSWDDAHNTLRDLRFTVFVDEQQVPEHLEIDEFDATAQHFLAKINGKAVATARLLADGTIGRMAVLPPYRHQGIGTALVARCVDAAVEAGLSEVSLSAQTQAIPFYEKAGFDLVGPIFMDAGIPHQRMVKALARQAQLGIDSEKFRVTDMAATVLAMSRQARRKLLIFSRCLEPEVYGSPALAEACSELARKHRDSEIRLLICDDRPLRDTRHPLVELSQRLSSSVRLRVLRPEHTRDVNEYFLLADKEGIIVSSTAAAIVGWASFYQRPAVREYSEQFERLWNLGKPSPWLRSLY